MRWKILASLKLSHQKAGSLKDWSKKWTSENLDQLEWKTLSDEEVFEKLNGIKGVGLWSMQMILMFTLERHDVFPISDYQMKKAICDVYGIEEDKNINDKMLQLSDKWIPHRSIAVRYLWRYRELKKKRLI